MRATGKTDLQLTSYYFPMPPIAHTFTPSPHESLAVQYEQKTTRALRYFEPTGVTHTGDLSDMSSNVLPASNELYARYNKESATVEIIRNYNHNRLVIAVAREAQHGFTVADPSAEGRNWLDAYRWATYPIRAKMLGVRNPHQLPEPWWKQHREWKATGQYAPKTIFALSLPDSPHIEIGVAPASGKTRVYWHGHPSTKLVAWMGHQGWTHAEVKACFATLQIPIADNTIKVQVSIGKHHPDQCAAVTPTQAAQLYATVNKTPTPIDTLASQLVTTIHNPAYTPSPKQQKIKREYAALKAAQERRK